MEAPSVCLREELHGGGQAATDCNAASGLNRSSLSLGWNGMTDTEAKGSPNTSSLELSRPSSFWSRDLPQKLVDASFNIQWHLASVSHGPEYCLEVVFVWYSQGGLKKLPFYIGFNHLLNLIIAQLRGLDWVFTNEREVCSASNIFPE